LLTVVLLFFRILVQIVLKLARRTEVDIGLFHCDQLGFREGDNVVRIKARLVNYPLFILIILWKNYCDDKNIELAYTFLRPLLSVTGLPLFQYKAIVLPKFPKSPAGKTLLPETAMA
jgi:hypothetical protein